MESARCCPTFLTSPLLHSCHSSLQVLIPSPSCTPYPMATNMYQCWTKFTVAELAPFQFISVHLKLSDCLSVIPSFNLSFSLSFNLSFYLSFQLLFNPSVFKIYKPLHFLKNFKARLYQANIQSVYINSTSLRSSSNCDCTSYVFSSI